MPDGREPPAAQAYFFLATFFVAFLATFFATFFLAAFFLATVNPPNRLNLERPGARSALACASATSDRSFRNSGLKSHHTRQRESRLEACLDSLPFTFTSSILSFTKALEAAGPPRPLLFRCYRLVKSFQAQFLFNRAFFFDLDSSMREFKSCRDE